MIFNSLDFLIFFPIVVAIYFILPKKVRYLWLMTASYYFYMCWNAKYVLLLLVSTVTTWFFGWMVHWFKHPFGKKASVLGCATLNLAILVYFKYFNFFLDTLNRVLAKAGVELINRPADVLLPVGISFYIFQALGYIIDVYRGRIEPEKNILKYALFVSFFPQLVAGPIERSENLLKQVREVDKIKVWNYERITKGFTLMVWGLFVKMVIADRVVILVNTVFDGFYQHGTVGLAAGAMGFALQIYCDFMGYSTIAVGAAKVMGFELMENFACPYFSRSVNEFWKRWHISLSSWFRDYVYIPLGGNRCSKIRKYCNVMITMGISGLWHGANWTFVAWGLLHGLYQVFSDITMPLRRKLREIGKVKAESFSFKLGQVVTTFVLVDLAWIFFRANSISDGIQYWKRMFTKWDPWNLLNGEIYTLGLDHLEMNVLIIGMVILFLVDLLRYRKNQTIADFLSDQCIWFRWLVILGLIFGVLIFGIYGIKFESSQFIYFQF